jgi:hypothetical protein
MKSEHLFSKPVPLDCLFKLLDQICAKGIDNYYYYIVDITTYKKMIYHQYHVSFLDTILPFYRKNRQYYVTREFTYNSFITLVRQICDLHNHPFLYDKKYHNQKYHMRYIVEKPVESNVL